MPKTTNTRATRAARRPSRRSVRPQMTERRAKTLARQLINDGALTVSMLNVIESLATAGALTTLQLQRIDGVSLRTLQRMFYNPVTKIGHIVDHLWADEKLIDVGFKKARGLGSLRVWKLGVLGAAIARERELNPVTYDTAFRVAQITHDVCCAEICSRIFLHAEAHGWTVNWLNKNDARVLGRYTVKERNKEVKKTRILIEPDALLKCEKTVNGKRLKRMFVVEFHNEVGSRRVKDKIERYTEAVGAQRYSAWGLDKMPTLLVGYRDKSIMKAYEESIAEAGKLPFRISFVPQMGNWVNDETGMPLLKAVIDGVVKTAKSDLFNV